MPTIPSTVVIDAAISSGDHLLVKDERPGGYVHPATIYRVLER